MFLAGRRRGLAHIDAAAVDFGMPMGPIELADTVGLDVCLHVGKILAQAFNRKAPVHLEELVNAKHFGRKTWAWLLRCVARWQADQTRE